MICNVVEASGEELAVEDFNLDEYVDVLSRSVVGDANEGN